MIPDKLDLCYLLLLEMNCSPLAGHLGAHVAGGFWAVILSQAVWKRSWAGHDPTHSIIVADRSVAITGDMALVQLLTA